MSKEFEDWFAKEWAEKGWGVKGGPTELCARRFSEMAFELARKDHYRIGEEVEVFIGYALTVRGKVVALYDDKVQGYNTEKNQRNVRRVPEWEPKEGEAVFALYDDGNIAIAKMKGRRGEFAELLFQGGSTGGWEYSKLKPFSADKIGKPWDEI